MALEMRKRRKFEPDEPFICRVEPGQSLVKVTQYETPLKSGFTGFDRVAIGKSFNECT